MSIDVLIKQRLFGNKTMPLKVILGEHLHYGHYVKEQLNVGELGETEFIAYNPKSIGRGFSAAWNPKEKKAIALRLPQPSTTQELRDFYDAIQRMVNYWRGILVVDGSRISLPDFLSTFDDTVDSNQRILHHFSHQVLDRESDVFTLYSTMWPLSVGKEEATMFTENPNYYAEWLHEKQSMNVYFASPDFYIGDSGIFARYILTNNLPAVFPYRPTVPFGVTDPATGKHLECKEWLIVLGIEGEKEPLCEMEYSKFLSLIPEDKKSKYDGSHFLLAEMTEEEIRAFCTQQI